MREIEKNGYFGVAIPKHDIIEGFFLPHLMEEAGQKAIGLIRNDPKMRPTIDICQSYDGASGVDNQLIGALGHHIINAVNDGRVVVLGMALSLILKTRFFWVQGDYDEKGGLFTDIGLMEGVTNPDEAKAFFLKLPSVRILRIKRSILALMAMAELESASPVTKH